VPARETLPQHAEQYPGNAGDFVAIKEGVLFAGQLLEWGQARTAELVSRQLTRPVCIASTHATTDEKAPVPSG
jgi:hypothetical protein